MFTLADSSATDAVPKKRGPKTEVLEELLKRVSGLEKQLQQEKDTRSDSGSPGGTNDDMGAGDMTMDETETSTPNEYTSPTPLLTPPIGFGEEMIMFPDVPDIPEPPMKKRRQSEPVFVGGQFQQDVHG